MELRAKIIGIESVFEGVVIVIQQDKMKIPLAEEPDSDESIIAKKFARGLKVAGFNIQELRSPCEFGGFKTGFWLTMEDYEQMGKPTVGDLLVMAMKVEK